MSSLSALLKPEVTHLIDRVMESYVPCERSEVVQRMITMLEEELAVMEVLKSEQEFQEGKALTGDFGDVIVGTKDSDALLTEGFKQKREDFAMWEKLGFETWK